MSATAAERWAKARTFHHSLYSAQRIASERTHSVSVCLPARECAGTVGEIVAALVALPAGSLAAVKALVAQAADGAYEGVLASERRFMIQNAAGADAREGIAAFIDRRAPAFGGAPGTTVSA